MTVGGEESGRNRLTMSSGSTSARGVSFTGLGRNGYGGSGKGGVVGLWGRKQ